MPKSLKSRQKYNKSKHSLSKYSKHKKSKSLKSKFLKSNNTLLNFKSNKSISIATNISDIKSGSSIDDIYSIKELHDNMQKICINKVIKKKSQGISLNRKISKDLCDCLFDKNKDLTITELESKINNKLETPGSQCIKLLDNYVSKNKSKSKSKIKSRSISKN
jgi:hypothetical protein